MLKPKDVQERLGISASALRLWSNTFVTHLSPSAQASMTERGTPAQRRYTERDVAVFLKVQALLKAGNTYEQINQQLADEPPPEPTPEPEPAPIEVLPALVPTNGHVPKLLEELATAHKETVAAKEETIDALKRMIDERDSTILQLREEVANGQASFWQRVARVWKEN